MKILVCEPGKHPYVKEIEHTLENLQKEVGGYIQALYPFEEEVAVVFELAKTTNAGGGCTFLMLRLKNEQ